MSSTLSIDSLVAALDYNNMKNKSHYKNVVLLSQRIQVQLELMKTYRRCLHVSLGKQPIDSKDDIATQSYLFSTIDQDSDDTCFPQDILSPTETILSYYTNESQHLRKAYDDEELLIDDYSRRSSEVTAVDNKVSRQYGLPCSSSAIEFSTSSRKTLVNTKSVSCYPTILPQKELPTPDTLKIKHVKKRYHLMGFLKRTYYLDNIMVKRNLTLPHLYASKDIMTGEKNGVLKLVVAYRYDHTSSLVDKDHFLIAFSSLDLLTELNHHQRRQGVSLIPKEAEDDKLTHAVAAWLQNQHILPSPASIRRVFRDGFKVYIVTDLSKIV
ncbi:hypothetical protein A0J61_02235 [Choanephora cucurbitarum]|uniref:Uncharacterized protein n=1 Tax=Choanephora cucurbitarum TaxID=101091 RepID=A0A1C7NKQ7_9FUNG|nr:hypothetical protein A0J61_02235 [Choanephora cucurbitarum]